MWISVSVADVCVRNRACRTGHESAERGTYQRAFPAPFSEDGKTVYTALSYNGSTYMPLRRPLK